MRASITLPSRVTSSRRTRATPSTRICSPIAPLAIWRITADGADLAQLVGLRVIGIADLHHEHEHAVARERAVDGVHRHGPVDGQRLDGQREHDRAAQRQDGQARGERWILGVGVGHESCSPECVAPARVPVPNAL